MAIYLSLLDDGDDMYAAIGGSALLHHAVDVEIDGHGQTGDPPHVDTTAYPLARGADPLRLGGLDEKNISSYEMAKSRDHWLAISLFDAWLVRDARR